MLAASNAFKPTPPPSPSNMSNSNSPNSPFADFDFAFDPSMSNVFPNPPPLPSSADLFSPAETTDLLGFLDNFNWDIEPDEPPATSSYPQHRLPSVPYSNPHLNLSSGVRISSRATTRLPAQRNETPTIPAPPQVGPSQLQHQHQPRSSSASSATRTKPLLSTPQKRLNHIMSEQKRRNAIRDGYAQLITLLSPADGAPGIGMPTRGRPKGSGSRGKGRSKGKSGVLFRAVEYCQWLEEGRDALREEVRRAEAAAGIINHQ